GVETNSPHRTCSSPRSVSGTGKECTAKECSTREASHDDPAGEPHPDNQTQGSRRSRWSKRVIIELGLSPDRSRQINHIALDGVLAKDSASRRLHSDDSKSVWGGVCGFRIQRMGEPQRPSVHESRDRRKNKLLCRARCWCWSGRRQYLRSGADRNG